MTDRLLLNDTNSGMSCIVDIAPGVNKVVIGLKDNAIVVLSAVPGEDQSGSFHPQLAIRACEKYPKNMGTEDFVGGYVAYDPETKAVGFLGYSSNLPQYTVLNHKYKGNPHPKYEELIEDIIQVLGNDSQRHDAGCGGLLSSRLSRKVLYTKYGGMMQ